jgi:hypothetical protein
MSEFAFRLATIDDIPFLIDTLIEAEKSGTDKLSYSTIFGLSETETKKYLTDMLNEEIDGCELSVSSFLVAVKDGQVVASLSAWIEDSKGISSSVLKGNLLNYTLPKKCIDRAATLSYLLRDLHFDYAPDSIQLGTGYVLDGFRNNSLGSLLIKNQIELLSNRRPDITAAYAQIFECNLPSIKMSEKQGFKIIMTKMSVNEDILQYLPCNKKILVKKEL